MPFALVHFDLHVFSFIFAFNSNNWYCVLWTLKTQISHFVACKIVLLFGGFTLCFVQQNLQNPCVERNSVKCMHQQFPKDVESSKLVKAPDSRFRVGLLNFVWISKLSWSKAADLEFQPQHVVLCNCANFPVFFFKRFPPRVGFEMLLTCQPSPSRYGSPPFSATAQNIHFNPGHPFPAPSLVGVALVVGFTPMFILEACSTQ